MFICMCVCSVPHGGASPFIINMDRMPAVIRRNPVRTHTQHRHVPGKESSGITQLLQSWTHVNVHTQDCKQALSMKLRRSMESCSHFKHHLFINPLYEMHTHRQVTEILQILPSHSDDQPHSLFLFLPPSLFSPKSMKCFVTQRCISCNIHLKKQACLTLNEFSLTEFGANLVKRRLGTHARTVAHTSNPIILPWGEGFVSYRWNLTVIYGKGESHYTLGHTAKQSKVTGPKQGHKERLALPP